MMPFLMSNFLGVMRVSNINPCCFQKINTRRTIGQRRGGAAAGVNQVPPQAPAEGVAMPVNPAGLIDVEKSEFASYRQTDVAQSWYIVSYDNRASEGGPITWDLSKMDFIECLFPR